MSLKPISVIKIDVTPKFFLDGQKGFHRKNETWKARAYKTSTGEDEAGGWP